MENKTILVVDDEPIVREAIRDWLKEAGYRVTTAASAEEGLEILNSGDYRLMVIDVRLPGKTGIRFLKEARALRPAMKAIVITAYPNVEHGAEAMKLGAVDYLSKPVSPEELEKRIRESLAG